MPESANPQIGNPLYRRQQTLNKLRSGNLDGIDWAASTYKKGTSEDDIPHEFYSADRAHIIGLPAGVSNKAISSQAGTFADYFDKYKSK
jgi:hypothetical protein